MPVNISFLNLAYSVRRGRKERLPFTNVVCMGIFMVTFPAKVCPHLSDWVPVVLKVGDKCWEFTKLVFKLVTQVVKFLFLNYEKMQGIHS